MKSLIAFLFLVVGPLGVSFAMAEARPPLPPPGPPDSAAAKKETLTEGKYLDPSCNCVRDIAKSPLLDAELTRKLQQESEKEKLAMADRLLSKVRNYRCPRTRAPRDDSSSSGFGTDGGDFPRPGRDDFGDPEETPDADEVLRHLMARARIDESRIDSEAKDRAQDLLERKLEKCEKEKQRKLQASRQQNFNSSAGNNSYAGWNGMNQGMNSMGMSGMGGLYGMYGLGGMNGMSGLQFGQGFGNQGFGNSMGNMWGGSMMGMNGIGGFGNTLGTGFGSGLGWTGNSSLLNTSSLAMMTPAQQVMWRNQQSGGMYTPNMLGSWSTNLSLWMNNASPMGYR